MFHPTSHAAAAASAAVISFLQLRPRSFNVRFSRAAIPGKVLGVDVRLRLRKDKVMALSEPAYHLLVFRSFRPFPCSCFLQPPHRSPYLSRRFAVAEPLRARRPWAFGGLVVVVVIQSVQVELADGTTRRDTLAVRGADWREGDREGE